VTFEACANDLLSAKQKLRPDEANHSIDQQWSVSARHRIGARLAGLLIHTEVRTTRECACLPSLEVHAVLPDGSALERLRCIAGLLQQTERNAKALVPFLGPATD